VQGVFSETLGTLVWELSPWKIRPVHWVKFTGINKGVEPTTEMPYLRQHAETCFQHGVVLRQLLIVDRKGNDPDDLGLHVRVAELEELLEQNTDVDTILMSHSTMNLQKVID
jgi:hypothetical protein